MLKTKLEFVNAGRRYRRKFKLKTVRLATSPGVAVAQPTRDLDVHGHMLRKLVRKLSSDPQHAVPGHGQMKLEYSEIDWLRKETAKLKAEHGTLKKAVVYVARCDHERYLARLFQG